MTGTNISYRTAIYMIAIIPPEPIYSEVKEFQLYFADHYKSKEAFRRPSHITIVPPFTISSSEEDALKKFILSFCATRKPFEISLNGFDTFSNTTIFVAPEKNDNLKTLSKELSRSFYKQFQVDGGRGPGYGFHPHMTVGFKDLTPDQHALAWQEFSNTLYRRRFILDQLCLLRHNGKEWIIIEKAILANESISIDSDQLSLIL